MFESADLKCQKPGHREVEVTGTPSDVIGQQTWGRGFLVVASLELVTWLSPILSQVKYTLLYTATGQILEAGLSLLLGTLSSAVSLLQQKFEIHLIQVSLRVLLGCQIEESLTSGGSTVSLEA